MQNFVLFMTFNLIKKCIVIMVHRQFGRLAGIHLAFYHQQTGCTAIIVCHAESIRMSAGCLHEISIREIFPLDVCTP